MAKITKQNIMDFSGLYFKVRGVLPMDEEPIEIEEMSATVTDDEDSDARAKIDEILTALHELGIIVKTSSS